MATVEAKVVDATHLELVEPLPEMVGRYVTVELCLVSDVTSRLLQELREAYLTIGPAEQRDEVAMAEEGILSQPQAEVEFPDEDKGAWWE
jgi:hypothetical protein